MTVIGKCQQNLANEKETRQIKGQTKIAEDFRIYANDMWIIHHPFIIQMKS